MNIFDKVRITDNNGSSDVEGKVLAIVTTTTDVANSDMTTFRTETVVKVDVLTFPKFKLISVNADSLVLLDKTDNYAYVAENADKADKPAPKARTTTK